MEEGETAAPFWVQTPTNLRHRSRFNSGLVLFILCLILSLFTLLIIPPLLSLSPQIPKPNLMKNSWQSFNIVIILVALLFGFFTRIRNQESISTVGLTASKERKSDQSTDTVWYDNSDRTAGIDDQTGSKITNDVKKLNESTVRSMPRVWYEDSNRTAVVDDQNGMSDVHKSDESTVTEWYKYSDRTAVIDDQTGSKIRNGVQKSGKSAVRGWYDYSDRTAVVDDRNGSKSDYSNPTALVGSHDRWRIYNDKSLKPEASQSADRADGNGSKMRNDVHKSDESAVRGWYDYSDRAAVVDDRNAAVVGSRDRWHVYDDTPLPPEASQSADRADGASHIRKADSPHLERVNREVNIINTGTVLCVVNGIACIHGLDEVSVGEIVEFDEGTIGIVLNWESMDSLPVQLMGDGSMIREGSSVNATGKIASASSVVNENDLASESRVIENRETNKIGENQTLPAVRRRKRRTTRSIAKRVLKSTTINTGTVLGVAFGIARIQCVEEVAAGEIIEFNEGTIGIALNSDYVILMGNGLMIQEGSCVKATGKIAQMPMSEAWLGGFLNALAKPIVDRGEIFSSESQLIEENEIEQMDGNLAPPSMVNMGKSSDEMNGHRPKMTYESATINNIQSHNAENLESLTHESIVPKEEASEDSDDEIEYNEYESSPSPIKAQYPPLSPTLGTKTEKKRGGNVTRDFLTSLGMKKKKQRQKSVESIDSLLESQPPSPPPPSAAIQSFFSLKKGKGKRVISIPPPPSPPPPYFTTSHERKSVAVEAPDIMRKPPLPVKVRSFVEVASTSGVDSPVTGSQLPLHPIPPPPLPPFQLPGWKFVVKGDYVKIASANTSRSVSPERDEVDTPRISDYGGDVVVGSSMFCPSPDVNSKADMFIANFRAGLKLQKMNSIKQKQGVGLSNLGPVEPNQAKA